jgi:NTP pyrophosphatase (non-canonical NTP hydrolase)
MSEMSSISTLLQDYHECVERTINSTLDTKGRLAMSVIGMAGEIGEISEPIKKYLYHGRSLNSERIQAEVGDVLWYLTALLSTLGLTLEDTFRMNMDKLMVRYPSGFQAESENPRITYPLGGVDLVQSYLDK